MQSLNFHPLAASSASKRRAVHPPSVNCAGRSKVETRAALREGGQLPCTKALVAAATGLSTLFVANPALADFDPAVLNTAQQLGTAGVAMVVSSAAAYGGVLLVQHMLKGFAQGAQQHQQQQQAHYTPEHTSISHARKGGNVPAFAFGGTSGTPSSTSISFQQAASEPSRSPAAVSAPAQLKSTPLPEPSTKKASSTGAVLETGSSSASHELLASMDSTPEPAAAVSAPAPRHYDSLFSAASGKSLQATFRHGSGCSGHSRAGIDFVSNLLSPINEPASGSEFAQAASATQAQILPREEKATELVSKFAAATEAAGDLLDAAEKESMTVCVFERIP